MSNSKVPVRPPLPATTTVEQELANLRAELAATQAENSTLKQKNKRKAGPFKMKVSEKGCLSVYGLQRRFPASFYANEWQFLFSKMDEIKQYIIDNADALKTDG